jgi:hypothetical protein
MKQKALLPKAKNSPAATIQNKSKTAFTSPAQFHKVNEKGIAEQRVHTDGTVQRVFAVKEDNKTITFNNADELKEYYWFQQQDPLMQQVLLMMFNANHDYKAIEWYELLQLANQELNTEKEYDKDDLVIDFNESEKKRKREKVDLDKYEEERKDKVGKRLKKDKNLNTTQKEQVEKFLQIGVNHCWAAVSYALHCHYGGKCKNIAEFVLNHASKNSIEKFNNDEVSDINEAAGSFSNRDFFTAIDTDMPVPVSEFEKETNANQPIVANVDGHYILIRSILKENNSYKMIVMDPDKGEDQVMDVVLAKISNDNIERVEGVGNYTLKQIYFTASKYTL